MLPISRPRRLSLVLSFALGLTPCIPALLSPGTAQEPRPAAADVDALIRRLGSDDFQEREEATRLLSGKDEAGPALRRLLKSRDAEVVRRASAILEVLAHRETKRAFEKVREWVKNGDLDLAFERFARRPNWEDEVEGWQVMAEMAGALLAREHKEFRKLNPGTFSTLEGVSDLLFIRDFRRFVRDEQPLLTRDSTLLPVKHGGRFLVRGGDLRLAGRLAAFRCLFVSSGRVQLDRDFDDSVIFATGSVMVRNLSNSVVVCGGNFVSTESILNCLIVAGGDVKVNSRTWQSRLISVGRVYMKPDNLINSVAQEKEAMPLGFVHFFEPSRVGISVEPEVSGVRVCEVAAGKAFGRAGLCVGDVVTELDGQRVDSPNSFRRALRARVAEGGEAVFEVRRGERTTQITVPVTD